MAVYGRDGSVSYVGATLRLRWQHHFDDDWPVADVWDGEKLTMVGRNGGESGWGDPRDSIDATPEVLEAVIADAAEANFAKLTRDDLERYLEARDELLTVSRGKRVRVTRGRKVPLGTTGQVFWLGNTGYGPRVGFRGDDGETYWTALTNVEVIDLDPDDIPLEKDFERPEAQRRASARALAEYSWAGTAKELAKAGAR